MALLGGSLSKDIAAAYSVTALVAGLALRLRPKRSQQPLARP